MDKKLYEKFLKLLYKHGYFDHCKDLEIIDIKETKDGVEVICNEGRFIKMSLSEIKISFYSDSANEFINDLWLEYVSRNINKKSMSIKDRAERFELEFHRLYDACRVSLYSDISFEEVFSSNLSRMDYLISLFKCYNRGQMDPRTMQLFDESIAFIMDFVNGNKKFNDIKVPNKYYQDRSINSYVCSDTELSLFLDLTKTVLEIYNMYYKDNEMPITLANESFNQNMTRVLKIEDHNLAHLLGLSEYEDINNPNPSKNLLRKHCQSIVENWQEYGGTEAERLLHWLISDEGKKELYRINQISHDFIENDRKDNPSSYDEDGNLKPIAMNKFKQRYKKSTGLDFPIINFSRWMCKTINTLNFLNLNNSFEVIVDYNAPVGKKNEKDLFIVNGNQKEILSESDMYGYYNNLIREYLKEYSKDENNSELKDTLIEYGLDLNTKEMKEQLNVMQVYDFVGAKGIVINDDYVDEKIIEALNKSFSRNVHLVGFDTEFDTDSSSLDDVLINRSHCDTSIALTVPELVGDYYKNGRMFFIDSFKSSRGALAISSVKDEVAFLRKTLDLKADSRKKLNTLLSANSMLKEEYRVYKKFRSNENDNGRDR